MSVGCYVMKNKSWLAGLLCLLVLAAFWSQALQVPFWQDDYIFLLNAQAARLEHQSWLAAFFPTSKVQFWRPLGMETYWRFLETFFYGNARAAHVINLTLLVASAAAVGFFVFILLKNISEDRECKLAGVLASFLYGIHASHFLPVAWAAAANDSIVVIFSALTLTSWIIVCTESTFKKKLATATLFCFFIMALLSKEIAFVLPYIGFLLTYWMWPKKKVSTSTLIIGAIWIGISCLWLVVHEQVTNPSVPEYQFKFGINILRNASSLVLFFFNTPREALRIFLVKSSVDAAIWGVVCFILQFIAFSLLIMSIDIQQKNRKNVVLLILIFVIGCAPYFLFAWNCYEYYTSIGLFAYAILTGLASHRTKNMIAVTSLAILSSTIATFGNYYLDYPALIARAKWAEKQLLRLSVLREQQPDLFDCPLYLKIENSHKFTAFGVSGLVYKVGIDKKKIFFADPNALAPQRPVLVVPTAGNVQLN